MVRGGRTGVLAARLCLHYKCRRTVAGGARELRVPALKKAQFAYTERRYACDRPGYNQIILFLSGIIGLFSFESSCNAYDSQIPAHL